MARRDGQLANHYHFRVAGLRFEPPSLTSESVPLTISHPASQPGGVESCPEEVNHRHSQVLAFANTFSDSLCPEPSGQEIWGVNSDGISDYE